MLIGKSQNGLHLNIQTDTTLWFHMPIQWYKNSGAMVWLDTR